MVYRLLSFLSALVLLSSCLGHSGVKDHARLSGRSLSNELKNVRPDGKYRASLIPLNSSVSGITRGTATVSVNGDQVEVTVRVQDAPATIHSQYIFSGTECPDSEDDLNLDGYLDYIEGSRLFGDALIPLDGNLDSQIEGLESFPKANSTGVYHYHQLASWDRMMSDLKTLDPDPNDTLVKSERDIPLEGQVVAVFAVDQSTYLPASVAAAPGASVRKSFPIACGVLVKVTDDE